MSDDFLEGLAVETAEHQRSRLFGKYRALVTDVDDPDAMGRLKAKVPEVLHDGETSWAMPSVPYAGKSHGLVLLPEVGDGVWIEFEAGDPSRPIWSGCWWSRDEGLPKPAAATVRVLSTTPGHQVVIDEDADEIILTHPGGAEVKLGASSISLTLGGSEITITRTDITLKSGAGQVKLSASGVSVNDGALEVS
jgi:uncharacterized protein involved in type VI secretion and phage assembly